MRVTVAVQVDMTRVLSTALQQQTQLRDGIIGEDTVAKHYMEFYFDLLRRTVSHLLAPGVVYVPGVRGFVSVSLEAANVPPIAASALGLLPVANVLASMNAAPGAAGDKDKGQTPPLHYCLIEHYMSWPGALRIHFAHYCSSTYLLHVLLFCSLRFCSALLFSSAISHSTASHTCSHISLIELVALAEILGVYGVRSLSEKLITATGNQIEELKVRFIVHVHSNTVLCNIVPQMHVHYCTLS